VFVSAGTYGGFALGQPARVLGAGGVTITSSVTVTNSAGTNRDVVLDGLDFAAGARLTISDVAVPTILRALSIGGSSTVEGLRIERSQVALQRVDATSQVVTVGATAHASNCALGRVNVTQGSRFVHAATSGSIVPDAGSSVTTIPGPSAILELAPAWPSGLAQTVAVRQGGAGHLFGLLLGTTHAYLELSGLPFDMVLLLAPSTLIVLPGGVLDPVGNASFVFPGPPNANTSGLTFQIQVQTLDPVAVRGRFAELRQILLLR
jgi:hypothetical protein